MRENKGFTLIELLAVLVVLAVILSISVPKVMDVRYESSKKAFTNDVDELQGIAQLEYNNKKEARLYNFEDGKQINVENEEDKLNFKGDNPGDGYIKIYPNGDIEYELTSRNHIFCASKEVGDRKGKVEKCKDQTIEKFTLNLSAVTTTNSIRVTVVPKDGEKDVIINEYNYQLDDGKVISSNKASHLYENLKAEENGKLKDYVIKVKACTKRGKCEEGTITVNLKQINEIEYKISPKDWSLEKTITFTYPEIKNVDGQSIGKNEISTDGGTTFKIYRGSITVNKDTTIVARITDGTNSLKSTAITLSQFDHTAPTITNVTGNPDKWTNQNVTLTVNGAKDKGDNNVEPGSGLADAAYSFDGGVTWQASASYTFKENKSGIVIKVRDKLGNIYTHSSIAITKIDKTAPVCGNWIGQNTTWTKNNVTVYAQCSDSGSGCKTSQSSGVLITGTTRTKSVSDIIEDNAGNKTTCTGTVNAFIDQTPPSCTSSGGSNAWTNDSRTLVGTCSDRESGCKENVSWLINWQGSWTNLSPGTVYDNVGNSRVCPSNQTVKIDKTGPAKPSIVLYQADANLKPIGGYTSGSWTGQNILIDINSLGDSGAGIDHYEYTVDGRSWNRIPTNDSDNTTLNTYVTNSRGNRTQLYFYIAWGMNSSFNIIAVDKVGNNSEASDTFTLRIDRTPPTQPVLTLYEGTVGAENDPVGNPVGGYTSGNTVSGDVNIIASSSDSETGINHYEYSHDNFSWNTLPGGSNWRYSITNNNQRASYWISWSGSWNWYIRSVDNAGNKSTPSYFSLNIKKPTQTCTSQTCTSSATCHDVYNGITAKECKEKGGLCSTGTTQGSNCYCIRYYSCTTTTTCCK